MCPTTPEFCPTSWEPRLRELAHRLRRAARAELFRELHEGGVQRPLSEGVGDLTFGLDAATESVLEDWFEEQAALAPLSLFSEDRGWRHRGPHGAGDTQRLAGFDHGGVRLMVDPVDGTRNLMADLRSAWSVLSLCGPGSEQPWLRDVQLGLVAELPDSRAARYRLLVARRGHGARFEERALEGDALHAARTLVADADERPDHGYFPIFRYTPVMRPRLAAVEAAFFARLAAHEGADLRNCFDDQYISNGGQLVLLTLGTYRLIADLRAHYAGDFEEPCTTSKPYDSAGAILVALEAGCSVCDVEGSPIDFPLDATTPVSFIGFANAASERRLGPHLRAAL